MTDLAEHGFLHRLRLAFSGMIVGGTVGLIIFCLAFAAFASLATTQLGFELTDEDGLFEWLGALAFLAAALLQLTLFWRSDVEPSQRLIPPMRRNVFHLALALVLFVAFGEEISWGQRIIGWATPADMLVENIQGETNLHNLAPFHGDSILNTHRLFNLFWFGYCVIVPVLAAAIPAAMSFFRRISLPMVPFWIGGLFVSAFVSWRIYFALEPAGAIADGQELSEATIAFCFLALGVAQLANIHFGAALESPSAVRRPSRTTPTVYGTDPQ